MNFGEHWGTTMKTSAAVRATIRSRKGKWSRREGDVVHGRRQVGAEVGRVLGEQGGDGKEDEEIEEEATTEEEEEEEE
jgi:hypothetical protein